MHLLLFTLLWLLAAPAFAQGSGVVLMYHRFDENCYPSTNIRSVQFEAQLDYLQENGFNIIPLRQMLQAIFNGHPLPEKAIALTTDDAYLSVYTTAYPILKRRGLPMTVFVSTDAVDERHGGFMNWQQMRQMQRDGIDFGNHGAAHMHMAHRPATESEAAWRQRVQADIAHAQQRLDEELGDQGQRLLAYPFGEYNSEVARLAGAMGYLALGQHSGAIGPGSLPQALPRFPINERYGVLETFAVKAASLPLPLADWQPHEPQLSGENNPPRLTLTLQEGAAISSTAVNCFLGSGRALRIEARSKQSLTVEADAALPAGRSRYNCTAAAGNGRFYWFSQPWFNGPDPADPAY